MHAAIATAVRPPNARTFFAPIPCNTSAVKIACFPTPSPPLETGLPSVIVEGEPDEPKRIAGYKAVDKHIAEEGEVIPLLQYVQPIIARKGLQLTPQGNGMLLPQTITTA